MLPGTIDAGLDCLLGDIQQVGRFTLRTTFDRYKDEGLAQSDRKFRDRLLNTRQGFAIGSKRFGIGLVIRQQQIVFELAKSEEAGRFSSPQPVSAFVQRNCGEKSDGWPFGIKFRARDPDRSKRGLDGIFCLIRRSEHTPCKGEQLRDERLNKPVKRYPAAFADLQNQVPFIMLCALYHRRSFAGVTGKRSSDLPVELVLLFGIKQPPHGEDVTNSRLLQIAHARMNLINRCRDFGPVFVFFFHGGGKLGIGGTKRQFQSLSLDGEIGFELVELTKLGSVKFQLVMHKRVQALLLAAIAPLARGKSADTTGYDSQHNREQDLRCANLHGVTWSSTAGERSVPSMSW